MPICVITTMAWKKYPCSIKSWQYITFNIALFFRPFMVSCLLLMHRLVLNRIRRAPRTLHFLGHLSNVSIVRLHPFELIQPMCQATAKYLNVRILTSSVRSINPYNIAGKNIHPNLIPLSTFPFKVEQRKTGCAHQCHLQWRGSRSDCHYLSCFQRQSWGDTVS